MPAIVMPTRGEVELAFCWSHVRHRLLRRLLRSIMGLLSSSTWRSPQEILGFRLQQCTRSATDVSRANPLRDNAFAVHPARKTKDGGPVSGDRLAELDAVTHCLVLARYQARQALPAFLDRLGPHVMPIHLHQVIVPLESLKVVNAPAIAKRNFDRPPIDMSSFI
jgi:hypothetical protein